LTLVIVGICCFTVYGIGFDSGKNSSNLDKIYAGYLNDILPDSEDEFTYIVFENNHYLIGHNVTKEQWELEESKYDVRFPNFTFQFFNDKGLFHKSSGGIIYS